MDSLTVRIGKSLGIFGGVQAAGIICSVVRAKIVALWLGPYGSGLFAIFNNALEMTATATQVGLRQSAVRYIAACKDDRASTLTLRLGWILGIAGAVVMLLIAPLLSRLSFGDETFTPHFRTLAVALIFMSATNASLAVLQGCGFLRRLAQAQLYGVIAGLTLSVPLFCFLGIASVVPSIIIYALSTAFFALVYCPGHGAVSLSLSLAGASPILRMGAYVAVASFVTLASDYVFISWLNTNASVDITGVYNAGYTLVNRCSAVLLAALAAEYYPRLATLGNDREALSNGVYAETGVLLRALLPIGLLLVAFDGLTVEILYSAEYFQAASFVRAATVGMAFKIYSWCMAFAILARGDGLVYLILETVDAIVMLMLNIFMFRGFGIAGLGYAYASGYLIYMLMTVAVCRFRYGIGRYAATSKLLFAVVALLAVAASLPHTVLFCSLTVIASLISLYLFVKHLLKK